MQSARTSNSTQGVEATTHWNSRRRAFVGIRYPQNRDSEWPVSCIGIEAFARPNRLDSATTEMKFRSWHCSVLFPRRSRVCSAALQFRGAHDHVPPLTQLATPGQRKRPRHFFDGFMGGLSCPNHDRSVDGVIRSAAHGIPPPLATPRLLPSSPGHFFARHSHAIDMVDMT